MLTCDRLYVVELSEGMRRERLPFALVQGDARAHRIGMRLTSGGQPVDLTGALPMAELVTNRRARVALGGEVHGDVVTVALSPECYAAHGRAELYITLRTANGCVATPLIVDADITRGSAVGALIDPSHVIPHAQELAENERQRQLAEAQRRQSEEERQRLSRLIQHKLDNGELAGAPGQLLYATFAVDARTRVLTMYLPDAYAGPDFRLNRNLLEVVL